MDWEPREHSFRSDDGERGEWGERNCCRVFLLLHQMIGEALRHREDLFSGLEAF